ERRGVRGEVTSPSPGTGEGTGVRAQRPGGQAGGRAVEERPEKVGGEEGKADQIVFALGPWLGKTFPDVLVIRPTRQELFYFGTPAGDPRFQEDHMPAWIDGGRNGFYGVPGNEFRGLKLADDNHGSIVDPETQERLASAAGAQSAREYLA